MKKRRDIWKQEIGEAIARLEIDKKVRIEDLQNDDSFIDTVMHASNIAMRNTQGLKRRALLNAIINSALLNPIDESIREMFLELIDTLTIWHLQILNLFQNPPKWFQTHDQNFPDLMFGGLSDVLEAAFPEMRGQRSIYDKIWQDLFIRGLVTTEILHVTMSGNGLLAKRTTELADQFIAFINEPNE